MAALTCLSGAALWGTCAVATAQAPPVPKPVLRTPSRVPKFTFADDLPKQEAQLADNPLLRRFRDGRRKQADDPLRPRYHFVAPEGYLNDPNGLCFWRGRWHLFYQDRPPDEPRWHWAHAVSDDLVRWRDLPYALYPDPEEQCYSGATLVEKDRVIAMYHGRGLGNMVAVSRDPLLLNWEKLTGDTVLPLQDGGKNYHFLSREPLPYRLYDPCVWKKGDAYYSLSGSVDYTGPGGKPVPAAFLFRSKDLKKWQFLHQFLENDRFSRVGDDAACPYFWPIGDRHILITFSHMSGAQYLLGDYDRTRDTFAVTAGGRFNFGSSIPGGGVSAPSATPDGRGGVIAIFNMLSIETGRPTAGLMTLPQRLTLAEGDRLRVEPAGDIASLRGEHRHLEARKLPANEEVVLPGVAGKSIELALEIDPRKSPLVELNVLRSPGREEATRIALFRDAAVTTRFAPPQHHLAVVTLDGARASLRPDIVARPPESAPVQLTADEPFRLRVFVDRSVVEVFVNGQLCLAQRVAPSRADSTGVSLRAQGSASELHSLDVWQMKGIAE
jgi:beta-fructofuranosidase